MDLYINDFLVSSSGYFAYDGCHKIYILANEEEEDYAKKRGYDIYPIYKLQEIYKNSCPLRFISSWDLQKDYVEQGKIAEIYVKGGNK